MQGRISGFFMTIFMVLPLAAIPLMSIFGIPQLGSMASSLDETGFFKEDPTAEASAPAFDVDLEPAPSFAGQNANDVSQHTDSHRTKTDLTQTASNSASESVWDQSTANSNTSEAF